jgi:membrane-bound lytic murein transglycosylase B
MSLRLAAASLLFLVLMPGAPAVARESAAPKSAPAPEVASAARRLKKEGLPRKFVDELVRSYDDSVRDEVVRLNVLGFLVKESDYMAHFSPRAVDECLEFLRAHRKAFALARERYGVQPAVVASLLWVETKHGRILGTLPVASVYFSLVQADQKSVIETTQRALTEKVGQPTPEQRRKVVTRSKEKAKWAIEELRALAALQKRRRVPIQELKGSFAGAFGVPQFIPSSYQRWAKAERAARAPDLFRKEDAIQSVAYYLKTHGWKKRGLKAQKKALHAYNRSEGYGRVILKLADCMNARLHPGRRGPAAKAAACDAE